MEQSSGKGLFFNTDLYASPSLLGHKQMQPEGIEEWRLRATHGSFALLLIV